ncbi:MAG: efflux RND transporter periplasmic adaptor subunit [Pseudomonadota bacterium]
MHASNTPWFGKFIALTLLSSLLIACGGQGQGSDQANDDSAEQQANDDGEDKPDALIPVEVVDVSRGDVFAAYTGSASLEAFEEATVVAKVGGEVRSILVEEGDVVERNQVLARLDGDRLRFQLQQSEANLRRLEQEYQRNVELADRGLVAASAFETTKYELDGLRAAYELAKLEYAYTTIRAPISGVIASRDIKVGNTIDPNAPTFRLTALDPLVAYLFIPEREFGRIKAQQPVSLTIDALPEQQFQGVIARISPTVDPESGTFKATVEVVDQQGQLKPGMFGRFAVIYDEQKDALLLPRDALIETTNGDSVYIVAEGVASRVPVTTGYAWEDDVAILEGIDDSARVVIVGQGALKTGSKVRVIGDPEPEPESESATVQASSDEARADEG